MATTVATTSLPQFNGLRPSISSAPVKSLVSVPVKYCILIYCASFFFFFFKHGLDALDYFILEYVFLCLLGICIEGRQVHQLLEV